MAGKDTENKYSKHVMQGLSSTLNKISIEQAHDDEAGDRAGGISYNDKLMLLAGKFF